MNAVTVLVTGVGAPGTVGTYQSLKYNWDRRKIRIIGTDIQDEVVGKYIMDQFYQVPKPCGEDYISALFRICRREKVDVVLPQCTDELLPLAKSIDAFAEEDVFIAVSDPSCVEIANNKYELLKLAQTVGVPTPHFRLASNKEQFQCGLKEVLARVSVAVSKPLVGHGSKGVHFHDDAEDSFNMDISAPRLIMEFLPNAEFTVDVLAYEGKTIVAVPRKRVKIRDGITWVAVVCRENRVFWDAKKLVSALGLSFACGFQFKLDGCGVAKLLECNPRVQGSMIASTYARVNVPYGAVKLALGEELPEFNIKWGTRMIRYWGAIQA